MCQSPQRIWQVYYAKNRAQTEKECGPVKLDRDIWVDAPQKFKSSTPLNPLSIYNHPIFPGLVTSQTCWRCTAMSPLKDNINSSQDPLLAMKKLELSHNIMWMDMLSFQGKKATIIQRTCRISLAWTGPT